MLDRLSINPHTSNMTKNPKRPQDANLLAKNIVDLTTGDVEDDPVTESNKKNAAAVALGRRGGLKGGKVRAERLTAEQRSSIAKKAAKARWKKKND